MTHRIELLWFSDCPNHPIARQMLADAIEETDASDPVVAAAHRFPGSPTIRVDGVDVEPGFVDPGDYAPRCRLFRTEHGLVGVPERRWIEDALR